MAHPISATRPINSSQEVLVTTINESQFKKLLNHLETKPHESIEKIYNFQMPVTTVNKAGTKITINVKSYRNTGRNHLQQHLRALEED